MDEGQSCFRKNADRRCAFCAAKGRTNETCMLSKKIKKTAEKKIAVNVVFVEKRLGAEKIHLFEKFKTVEKSKAFEKKREFEKNKKSEKIRLSEKKTLFKKTVHDDAFFKLAQFSICVFSSNLLIIFVGRECE